MRPLVPAMIAGLTMVSGGRVSAAASLPSCTVTSLQLAKTAYGGGGVALSATTGRQECFGSYVFLGVHVRRAGYPLLTYDNYNEVALAVHHWQPADGVPAVDQWVRWSPAVQAGLRAAGLRPTLLLQWIDAYAGPAAARTPGLWPPFLRRGHVPNPAVATRGAVTPLVVPPARAERSAGLSSGAIRPEVAPPRSVRVDQRAVPCAVVPACRRTVLRYERWRGASPWKRQEVLWLARWPWVIGVLGLAGVVAQVWRIRSAWRRNLRWYGSPRVPQ